MMSEAPSGAWLRFCYLPADIFSAYAIIRLSTLSFEFLHMLIISNNSGSSAFEIVYETWLDHAGLHSRNVCRGKLCCFFGR